MSPTCSNLSRLLRMQMLISKLKKKGAELLPEASTCDKHLYLPEYSTIEEVGGGGIMYMCYHTTTTTTFCWQCNSMQS
jgi:hypothetical protein